MNVSVFPNNKEVQKMFDVKRVESVTGLSSRVRLHGVQALLLIFQMHFNV